MTTTATKLRNLVLENRWTDGRISKESIGEDYAQLTALYRKGLDVLTEWASKDYSHNSTQEDVDRCFLHIKNILELFTTEDNRITIDKMSMRTMRDCATKPKRLYSKAYMDAMKAKRNAANTVKEREADLIALGVSMPTDTETLEQWTTRIRESKVETKVHGIDMLDMYKNALSVLAVKTQAVEDVKSAGNYAWKRPVAVTLKEFAELIENYIGDCLEDGYNIKPTAVIRAEKAEARKAKAAATATATTNA